MNKTIQNKYEKLLEIINKYQKPLLALSGGLDSSFLSYAIKNSGANGQTITIKSPFFPNAEIERAQNIAKQFGLPNHLIDLGSLHLKILKNNHIHRCYYCKRENFGKIIEYANSNDFDVVFDGTIHDDSFVYRPGMKAIKEHGVVSPLQMAELSKMEIRELCREFNLDFAELPSFSCFATRFPYNEELTLEKVKRVNQAEKFMHGLGFIQFRVRSHNNIARIEIDLENINKFVEPNFMKIITKKFKQLGFDYVTLDLEGFRSGSMDENIT